jgi:hypothetical protein
MAAQSSLRPVVDREIPLNGVRNEAYASGVSWAAVAGGAFVAAALSLILLSLGTGLPPQRLEAGPLYGSS